MLGRLLLNVGDDGQRDIGVGEPILSPIGVPIERWSCRLYGGETANPTYRNHGSHAEAIEITYDPARTDYRALLEFFFQVHDPTTLNRQGNDAGLSYRSAIFYLDDEQRRVADATIAEVDASGLWPRKVVTEVTPAGAFWKAEPEHQDYLQR
ncbi:peptide-methionine (S)-S-oxide reductase MsrA [Streptomyces sp. NBC_01483]|uniref:peptide-methionine (S)-S-oxide reductase MsrA n=1 Tax=Streptomyces sp. NBC_01483 TaxID=2903883 RepID=UPI002E34B91C|nr:peptide-methionine (S)-S-oxide reductase MsrA [Streptomyces sp. NBC_01483]